MVLGARMQIFFSVGEASIILLVWRLEWLLVFMLLSFACF